MASAVIGVVLLIAAGPATAKPKLTIADASAAEGGALAFKISLKPKSNKKVKVNYATADGTAGSADYEPVSGTLKFKAKKTKAEILVPSSQDSLDEPEETLSVTLSKPKGAKITVADATGTILDDDAPAGGGSGDDTPPGNGLPTPVPAPPPTVSFGPAVSASEGNPADPSTVGPPVLLSAPSASQVSVSFSVSGGTATQPADLTAATGTVVFPPGQTAATIDLGIVRDYVAETDETVELLLSNPVNATLGNAAGSLTVVNDDAVAGDLVITELMPNPQDLDDDDGEWVELLNVINQPINLSGLQVRSGASGLCTVTGTIPPRAYFVASPNPQIADSTCGAGGLSLTNLGTTVSVRPPDLVQVDSMTYSGSTAGSSLSLDPDFLTAAGNDEANFCLGVGTYGPGTDQGTPGVANAQCP